MGGITSSPVCIQCKGVVDQRDMWHIDLAWPFSDEEPYSPENRPEMKRITVAEAKTEGLRAHCRACYIKEKEMYDRRDKMWYLKKAVTAATEAAAERVKADTPDVGASDRNAPPPASADS